MGASAWDKYMGTGSTSLEAPVAEEAVESGSAWDKYMGPSKKAEKPYAPLPAGTTYHDGDSRNLEGGGTNRYKGIKAPEVANPAKGTSDQIGGREAQAAMQSLMGTGGSERAVGREFHGRTLVEGKTAAGQDAAAELIGSGWAQRDRTDTNPERAAADWSSQADFDNPYGSKFAGNKFRREHNDEIRASSLDAMRYADPSTRAGTVVNEFGKGLNRGAHLLKSSTGGLIELAGDTVGSEGMAKYGHEVSQNAEKYNSMYAPKGIASTDDIHGVKDAIKWAAGTLGETVPQALPAMAAMAIPGGAGVEAAVASRLAAGGLDAVSAASKAKSAVAIGKGMMLNEGNLVGENAASVAHNYNDKTKQFENNLADNKLSTVLTGTAAAFLDTASLHGISKGLGLLAKSTDTLGTKVAKGVGRLGIASQMEGVTEAGQKVLEEANLHQANPDHAFAPKGWWNMVKEDYFGGTVGGVGFHTMGGAADIMRNAISADDKRQVLSPERQARNSNVGDTNSPAATAVSELLGFPIAVAGNPSIKTSGKLVGSDGKTSIVYGPHDENDDAANAKAIVGQHFVDMDTAVWATHPHVAKNIERQVQELQSIDPSTPVTPEESDAFKRAIFTKALANTQSGDKFAVVLQRTVMNHKSGAESIPWADVNTETGKSLTESKTTPLSLALGNIGTAAAESGLIHQDNVPQYIDTIGMLLDISAQDLEPAQAQYVRDSMAQLRGDLPIELFQSLNVAHATVRGTSDPYARNIDDPGAKLSGETMGEAEFIPGISDDKEDLTEQAIEGVNLHADKKLKHVLYGADSLLEATVPQYKKDEQGSILYDELENPIRDHDVLRKVTGEGWSAKGAQDMGRTRTEMAPEQDAQGLFYTAGDDAHGVVFKENTDKEAANIHHPDFDHTTFYYKTRDGEMDGRLPKMVEELNTKHMLEKSKAAKDEGAEEYYRHDALFDEQGNMDQVYKLVQVRAPAEDANTPGKVLGHVITRMGDEAESDAHNIESKIQRMSFVASSIGHAGRGPGSAAVDEHGGLVASDYARDNFIPFYDTRTGDGLPRYMDPMIASRLGKEIAGKDIMSGLSGTAADIRGFMEFVSYMASQPQYMVNPIMWGLGQEDAKAYVGPDAYEKRDGMTRLRTDENGKDVIQHMPSLHDADLLEGKAEYILDSLDPRMVIVPGKNPIRAGDLARNDGAFWLTVEKAEAKSKEDQTIVDQKIGAWEEKHGRKLPDLKKDQINSILESRGLSKIGAEREEVGEDPRISGWGKESSWQEDAFERYGRSFSGTYDDYLGRLSKEKADYDEATGIDREDRIEYNEPYDPDQGMNPYKVASKGTAAPPGDEWAGENIKTEAPGQNTAEIAPPYDLDAAQVAQLELDRANYRVGAINALSDKGLDAAIAEQIEDEEKAAAEYERQAEHKASDRQKIFDAKKLKDEFVPNNEADRIKYDAAKAKVEELSAKVEAQKKVDAQLKMNPKNTKIDEENVVQSVRMGKLKDALKDAESSVEAMYIQFSDKKGGALNVKPIVGTEQQVKSVPVHNTAHAGTTPSNAGFNINTPEGDTSDRTPRLVAQMYHYAQDDVKQHLKSRVEELSKDSASSLGSQVALISSVRGDTGIMHKNNVEMAKYIALDEFQQQYKYGPYEEATSTSEAPSNEAPSNEAPIDHTSTPEDIERDINGAEKTREGFWKLRASKIPEIKAKAAGNMQDLLTTVKDLYSKVTSQVRTMDQFEKDYKDATGVDFEYEGGKRSSGMFFNSKVYVDNTIDEIKAASTLLHEYGHALDAGNWLSNKWSLENVDEVDRVLRLIHGDKPAEGSELWQKPNELVAEFNVIRHLLPDEAKKTAPVLFGMLETKHAEQQEHGLSGMEFPEGITRISGAKNGKGGYNITKYNSDATGIRRLYDTVAPLDANGKRTGDPEANKELLFNLYRDHLAEHPEMVKELWEGALANGGKLVDYNPKGGKGARGHSQIYAHILNQMAQGVPVSQASYEGMSDEDAKALNDEGLNDQYEEQSTENLEPSDEDMSSYNDLVNNTDSEKTRRDAEKVIRGLWADHKEAKAAGEDGKLEQKAIDMAQADYEKVYGEKYQTQNQKNAAAKIAADKQARKDAAQAELDQEAENKAAGKGKTAPNFIGGMLASLHKKYPGFSFSQEETDGTDRAKIEDGHVTLYGNNLPTEDMVYDAIEHEVTGHGAMRYALQDKFDSVIKSLLGSKDPEISKKFEEIKGLYPDASDSHQTEEVAAAMAEQARQLRVDGYQAPSLEDATKAFEKQPSKRNLFDLLNASHQSVLSSYMNGDFQSAGALENLLHGMEKLGGKISDKALGTKVGQLAEKAVGGTYDFASAVASPMLKAVHERALAMVSKDGKIAEFMNRFYHEIGDKGFAPGSRGETLTDVVDNVEGRDRMEAHKLFEKFVEKLPKQKGFAKRLLSKSDKAADAQWQEDMEAAFEASIKGSDAGLNDQAASIFHDTTAFMGELNEWLRATYPTLRDDVYNAKKERTSEGGFSSTVPIYLNHDAWVQGHEDIVDKLVTLGKMNKKDAESLWANKAAAMSLIETEILQPMTSSFDHNFIPEGAREALMEYYDKDILGNIRNYIHSATKRGVLDKQMGKYVIGDDGVERFDATYYAREASDSLSDADRDDFNKKIMPALLGTLGSRMSDELRSINSWGTVFLNTTLLPLSLLSQFVDLGGMAVRDEHAGRVATHIGKLMFDKDFRKQMVDEANKVLPTIHRDVAEMLTSSGMGTFTSKAAAVNSMFFKLNQMQRWSEASRIIAYTLAKSAVARYAEQTKSNDAGVRQRGHSDLHELNLTPAEVDTWIKGGQQMDDAKFIEAMNKWVDGAVIKPGAAIRPVYQSDASKALLAYLHSYTNYSHEVFGKRIAHNMERRTGGMRLAPVAIAAGTMIPLVMFGASLRAMVSNVGGDDEEDKKKKQNVLGSLMRTGLLGAGAQTAWDMYEAQGHGGSMLASLTVPTSVLEQMLKTIYVNPETGLPELDEQKAIGEFMPVLSKSQQYRKMLGSEQHTR